MRMGTGLSLMCGKSDISSAFGRIAARSDLKMYAGR